MVSESASASAPASAPIGPNAMYDPSRAELTLHGGLASARAGNHAATGSWGLYLR